MPEQKYVPYSKCYISKNNPNVIPEYLRYALKNGNKTTFTNYQSPLSSRQTSSKEAV